jgi:hypothetical protein
LIERERKKETGGRERRGRGEAQGRVKRVLERVEEPAPIELPDTMCLPEWPSPWLSSPRSLSSLPRMTKKTVISRTAKMTRPKPTLNLASSASQLLP